MENPMVWLLLIALVALAVLVILVFRIRNMLRVEEGVNSTLRAENEALAQSGIS
jgi:hypothetical protein